MSKGEVDPARKVAQKEIEARSLVEVQFVYLPQPSDPRVDLPKIEASANAFFSPKGDANSDQVKNVFIIDGSFLRGFDYKHFWEWYEKTGNYFDAYLQHAKTGEKGASPFATEELQGYRDWTDGQLTSSYYSPEDFATEEGYSIFFYGALLMADRLSKGRNFTLAIEDLTIKDLLRLGKKHAGYINESESEEDDRPITFDDFDTFIEEQRLESEQFYRDVGKFEADRNASFGRFFKKIVDEAVQSGKKTRILVPRDIISFLPDHETYKDGMDGQYTSRPAIFVKENQKPSLQMKLAARFTKDGNATITREETVQLLFSGFIMQRLQDCGMPSLIDRLPEVFEKATPQELEKVLKASLEENGTQQLLDFFGERTTGTKLGSLFFGAREVLSGLGDTLLSEISDRIRNLGR